MIDLQTVHFFYKLKVIMNKQEQEQLYAEINGLLELYNMAPSISKDKRFVLDDVKDMYSRMFSYIIKDENQINRLQVWMDEHDFWKSPASTRFHGDFESGLCVHTLMVIVQTLKFAQPVLKDFFESPLADNFNFTAKDIFLSALVHDFCKAGSYGIEYRNAKDFQGNWIKKPFFKTRENLRNLGHGNESVLILLEILPEYVKNRCVIEAVSRHMGFSDLSDLERMNYSNFLQNPLVVLIQLADQSAAAWYDC